jgi:hypothetical protein
VPFFLIVHPNNIWWQLPSSECKSHSIRKYLQANWNFLYMHLWVQILEFFIMLFLPVPCYHLHHRLKLS